VNLLDSSATGSTGGWAIKSNFPLLNSGRVFRWDWWVCFYQFVVCMLITIALCTRVIPQVRKVLGNDY
jgi:hypothetical protein